MATRFYAEGRNVLLIWLITRRHPVRLRSPHPFTAFVYWLGSLFFKQRKRDRYPHAVPAAHSSEAERALDKRQMEVQFFLGGPKPEWCRWSAHPAEDWKVSARHGLPAHATVAQLAEQLFCKQQDAGSMPVGGSMPLKLNRMSGRRGDRLSVRFRPGAPSTRRPNGRVATLRTWNGASSNLAGCTKRMYANWNSDQP